MGTEEFWVPAAIAAVSAAGEGYNQYDTSRRQDRTAAAGIRQQSARQQQANAAVGTELNTLKASNADTARKDTTDAFLNQLRATRGQAIDGSTGKTSGAYNEDLTSAKSNVADFGARRADIMARIAAPGIQRQQEGQSMGRLAGTLGTIGNMSAGDQFLSDLRTRNTRANPWITAGSEIGNGVAGGMASQGGYGDGGYGGDAFVDPNTGMVRSRRGTA